MAEIGLPKVISMLYVQINNLRKALHSVEAFAVVQKSADFI